jgi:hypothetical protein
MNKKELDLKKITQQSFDKAFNQHGLKKSVLNEQETVSSKPQFNILDYVPALKTTTKSLEQIQPKNLNEEILRNVFGKLIVENNFKQTIKNIENILLGKEKSADFSLKFNALAVLNAFAELPKQNPQVSGWLMEVMMAGLVDGYKVGQEGKAADIIQKNGDEVSIKAPTPQADGRIQFKQGLKNLTDSIIKKGSIPYYFALLVNEPNGFKIEFTEIIFDKSSFSPEGFFSKGFNPDTNDMKKNHWADLFNIFFADQPEKAEVIIQSFFKDQRTNDAEKFFDFIKRSDEIKVEPTEKIKKENKIISEAAYQKSFALQKFRQIAGQPIATLFVSQENILKQYSGVLEELKKDFEDLLAPAHYSMFYLNDFLLNKKYDSIVQSRNNSEKFVSQVNEKQGKLKAMSIAERTSESLNLTDEAAIVMEMLQRMEE